MTGPERRRGVVVSFDEAVGLGHVEAVEAVETVESRAPAGRESAPPRYLFHCTQIADGSRTIAVGTAVTFVVVPGRGGRWEGAEIRVVGEPPA